MDVCFCWTFVLTTSWSSWTRPKPANSPAGVLSGLPRNWVVVQMVHPCLEFAAIHQFIQVSGIKNHLHRGRRRFGEKAAVVLLLKYLEFPVFMSNVVGLKKSKLQSKQGSSRPGSRFLQSLDEQWKQEILCVLGKKCGIFSYQFIICKGIMMSH